MCVNVAGINNFGNGYLLTISISNEQFAVRPAASVPK